jgi:hypothetical protein
MNLCGSKLSVLNIGASNVPFVTGAGIGAIPAKAIDDETTSPLAGGDPIEDEQGRDIVSEP